MIDWLISPRVIGFIIFTSWLLCALAVFINIVKTVYAWAGERQSKRWVRLLKRAWGANAREIPLAGTRRFYTEIVQAALSAEDVELKTAAPGRVVLRAKGVPLDAWLAWHLQRNGMRRHLNAVFDCTKPAGTAVSVEVGW